MPTASLEPAALPPGEVRAEGEAFAGPRPPDQLRGWRRAISAIPQLALFQELLQQPRALRRLLDLRQVTSAGHERVVVAVLLTERLVGGGGGGRAPEIRIGAD